MELVLVFPKAIYLVGHIFYRELVVFIIILFSIFLFMLAIILCSESDLPDSVGSGLLISVLGKRTLLHLIVQLTLVTLMPK